MIQWLPSLNMENMRIVKGMRQKLFLNYVKKRTITNILRNLNLPNMPVLETRDIYEVVLEIWLIIIFNMFPSQ